MPYGNSQRLGENINPQLMQVDFSPYERAGATTGNALANIGQQIGGVIKQYGDDEKTIKKSAQMAKSIRDAIPELAGMANNALAELSNPDLSQRDRLAIAEGIQDSLKIGVMGLENNRSNAMMQLEADKIQASMQGKARNIMTADELQQQIQSGAKVKYVPLGNGMYEVEGATANEVPMFGGVYADENGQIRQAPSGGGNIRIPGAGGQIQNALPQGQGGQFPDGVPTASDTPMPGDGNYPNYGSFEQATQGISVDGAPGVLPPKQGAAQQIQTAQSLVPNAPVPKGDVFTAEGGNVGVTRLKGSTPEIEYQLKEQALAKAKADADAAKVAADKANNSAVTNEADARFILDKSAKAKKMIKSSIGDGVGGAILDIGKSKVPGTTEYILESQVLAPIRNSLALANLKKMREDSPTGASGMGSLTEKEGTRLESKSGTLQIGGDKNILMQDISNIQKDTLDTVHGTKEQRAKFLKEGKITQQQNDEVEAIYADYGFGKPKSNSLVIPTNILDILNKHKQ